MDGYIEKHIFIHLKYSSHSDIDMVTWKYVYHEEKTKRERKRDGVIRG